MKDYPIASTEDELIELLGDSSFAPEYLTNFTDRLIQTAKQRADARGENSALDGGDTEYIITTEWVSFAADEFGYDGDTMNQVALGVLNEDASSGKDATLFNDTIVVQDGWLTTGDGRKTQMERYVDDEFDKADEGEMWIPNSAQEYICIVGLAPELVHGEPDLADAM